MGMEQATAVASRPASSTTSDTGLTLAGLIDVLGRADEVLVRRGPRPRHPAARRPAAHRPAGTPRVADHWDPMRTMQSQPPQQRRTRPGTTPTGPGPARPAPLRSVQPAPAARPPLATATPRRTPAPVARPTDPVHRPRLTGAGRLRALLRGLTRRAALWGAGPGGAYLAWGGTPPRPAYRAGAQPVDPPVVLRELPSTPTVTRATPSPVAPLPSSPPRRQAPSAPPAPPPAPGCRQLLSRVPAPSAGTPATGAARPPQSRARAPAGIRGSPGEPLARGSPSGWPDTG